MSVAGTRYDRTMRRMATRSLSAILLAIGLLLARPLDAIAQVVPVPHAEPVAGARTESTSAPSLTRVALGTVAGAAIGAAFGGLLGAAIDDEECGDDHGIDLDCLEGVGTGAMLGATLAVPMAAHAGNRYRGSFIADLAVSVGVLGATLGIAALTDEGALFAVPIVQIPLCIWAERRAGRE
jgi:hypothetical protein